MPQDIYTTDNIKYFSLFTQKLFQSDKAQRFSLSLDPNVCIQNCPLQLKCKTKNLKCVFFSWKREDIKKNVQFIVELFSVQTIPMFMIRTNYSDINYLEDPNYCPITVLLAGATQNQTIPADHNNYNITFYTISEELTLLSKNRINPPAKEHRPRLLHRSRLNHSK